MATHSVGGADSSLAFTDGQLVETDADGMTRLWGSVLEWAAPTRVQFTWHPGSSPESSTLVTVRFLAAAHGSTTVELTHDGWEVVGDTVIRSDYEQSWDVALGEFAAGA